MARCEPECAVGRPRGGCEGRLFPGACYDSNDVRGDRRRRAGLTERTFFRYFRRQREVLLGPRDLRSRHRRTPVEAAPATKSPLVCSPPALEPLPRRDRGAPRNARLARPRATYLTENTPSSAKSRADEAERRCGQRPTPRRCACRGSPNTASSPHRLSVGVAARQRFWCFSRLVGRHQGRGGDYAQIFARFRPKLDCGRPDAGRSGPATVSAAKPASAKPRLAAAASVQRRDLPLLPLLLIVPARTSPR